MRRLQSMEGVVDAAESTFFSDIQSLLHRKRISLDKDLSTICAVDAAYAGSKIAAVALLSEQGRIVEKASCVGRCSFPYVSGLFYLREGPFVTEAVRRLAVRPQLVCFDAHGAVHPRGKGLATVCGIVLGIPSIGIAKSLMVGEVTSSGRGFKKVILDRKIAGLVSESHGSKRYWSAGYSVNFAELKYILRQYGEACMEVMSEADKLSKELVRNPG